MEELTCRSKGPRVTSHCVWQMGAGHGRETSLSLEGGEKLQVPEEIDFKWVFRLGFPGGSVVENPPTNAEVMGSTLSWRSPKRRATLSSILAWVVPWTEEPGRVYEVHKNVSMGSHKNRTWITNWTTATTMKLTGYWKTRRECASCILFGKLSLAGPGAEVCRKGQSCEQGIGEACTGWARDVGRAKERSYLGWPDYTANNRLLNSLLIVV